MKVRKLQDEGRHEKALKLASQMLEGGNGTAEARMLHASLLAAVGDYSAAAESAAVASSSPDFRPPDWFTLGRYRMKAHDYALARVAFSRFVDGADPDEFDYFGGSTLLYRSYCALMKSDCRAALEDAMASTVEGEIWAVDGLISRDEVIARARKGLRR